MKQVVDILAAEPQGGDCLRLATPWRTAVAWVLYHGRRAGPETVDWSWIDDSALAEPESTHGVSSAVLSRLLEAERYPSRSGALLKKLAAWWVAQDHPNPLASTALDDESKSRVRKATGLSLELLDRLYLVVGERPVFPISRGLQRIICRHGWLDPQTEYADWQAALCGLTQSPDERLHLWRSLGRIETDYCGPAPRCDGCPLAPLLPAHGPRSLDD